ncbi:MAG TPA: helix-turn-helix domain-containing protein [Polyangiaceae bacterium]|jgi:hypothetical protein
MDHADYLTRVGRVLRLSQGELARELGISRRTVNRWVSRGIVLAHFQAQDLARLVHPADPGLAAEIAAAVGSSLPAMGIPAPSPAAKVAAPPPHPGERPAHLVDVVVCAAAEALDASPRAVRPALLAAFRRAREAGFTIEDVEKALSATPRAPRTKA